MRRSSIGPGAVVAALAHAPRTGTGGIIVKWRYYRETIVSARYVATGGGSKGKNAGPSGVSWYGDAGKCHDSWRDVVVECGEEVASGASELGEAGAPPRRALANVDGASWGDAPNITCTLHRFVDNAYPSLFFQGFSFALSCLSGHVSLLSMFPPHSSPRVCLMLAQSLLQLECYECMPAHLGIARSAPPAGPLPLASPLPSRPSVYSLFELTATSSCPSILGLESQMPCGLRMGALV